MAQPPAGTESAPAQTAEAQPATGAQIADVVGTEFPTYDKNGDGSLSATEFSAWMVALKTASDPSTKATAPATKTWVATAFAQAGVDLDRPIALTCGSGITASTLAFGLHLLGKDAALYDGSWSEWGADRSTPKAMGAKETVDG